MTIKTRLKCDRCHAYRNNTIVLPTDSEEAFVWCDICLVMELAELRYRRQLAPSLEQAAFLHSLTPNKGGK